MRCERLKRQNSQLDGVLPKTYNRLERSVLFELLRTMAQIPMDIEGDVFGKIYEYFLGNFAMAEGRKRWRVLHTHLSRKTDCRDSPAVSKDGFWTQRAVLAVCLSKVTSLPVTTERIAPI